LALSVAFRGSLLQWVEEAACVARLELVVTLREAWTCAGCWKDS
jgi:hypothetical protein